VKKNTFIAIAIILFAFGFFTSFKEYHDQLDCANSITCIENLEAEVTNEATATFLGENITVPQIDLAQENIEANILGQHTSAEESSQKHIYVDLSKQTLYAYDGAEEYFNTFVSTGRWGRTPTGDFNIWIKIRSTKMSGGSGNDYYYLPNVPYVMYFYNSEIPKSRGYGLHGTYWHNNFGNVMSHGCVNLRNIDAKKLYDWTTPTTIKPTTYATKDDPGTPITICQELQITEGEKPTCLE
jgi:hypothetical protein